MDIFDPDLGIVENMVLAPKQSGIYKDIMVWENGEKGAAGVVHGSHRLVSERYEEGVLEFVTRGPAQTPATVCVWTGSADVAAVVPKDSGGAEIPTRMHREKDTVRLEFDNCPDGTTVSIRLAM